MTSHEARQILIKVKGQLRDRKVFQAVDKALQALAWQEIQEKSDLFDDENLESGFEQQQ